MNPHRPDSPSPGALPPPGHEAAHRQDRLSQWCDPTLLQAIHRAIQPLPAHTPVGVALSAGPDSAMLAVHATAVARQLNRPVHAFHIHHGLQAPADTWLNQAHALAGLLQIHCHSRRVQVRAEGQGLEAAARNARYVALAQLATDAGVPHMLLAHHQDDQAETVLLRLLRGSGPEGLSAMAPVSERLGLQWLRPWLDQPRSRILARMPAWTQATGWTPAVDPTNHQAHYARGALRTALAPVLDTHWPHWRTQLARHAQQARELQQWVARASAHDLQTLDPDADGQGFALLAWRALPPEQQVAVLRHWLKSLGVRMPTSARLENWLRQLRTVHALGHDRQVTLHHDGGVLRVVRGRLRFEFSQ